MARRHKKTKNESKIIIAISVCLLFIMSIGYSAFQTNLNINAKGNVEKSKYLHVDDLKQLTVTTGDGLYKDTYEEGKFLYRGTNPNNYISLDGSIWRIISIEANDTLRIINNSINSGTYWDVLSDYERTDKTYCTENSCNAWAATNNLKGSSSFSAYYPFGSKGTMTGMLSGTVERDSTINTFLNTTVYNGYSSNVKEALIPGEFYIGMPGNGNDTEDIKTNLNQIKQFIWEGKIGLINIMEYLQASTNESCKTLKDGVDGNCAEKNWLNYKSNLWTISGIPSSQSVIVWYITYKGICNADGVADFMFSSSVSHVSKDVKLSGTGTPEDPYIVNI